MFEELQRLAEIAIPGTVVEVRLRCGTPSCGCHRDPALRHGPYPYVKYRSPSGRSTGVYVPREREVEVRRAAAAWSEAWEVLVMLGEANLEDLRQRLRSQRKARARSGRSAGSAGKGGKR